MNLNLIRTNTNTDPINTLDDNLGTYFSRKQKFIIIDNIEKKLHIEREYYKMIQKMKQI